MYGRLVGAGLREPMGFRPFFDFLYNAFWAVVFLIVLTILLAPLSLMKNPE